MEDVQNAEGYPGSFGCNKVIPHAKWHAQSAASLSDMTVYPPYSMSRYSFVVLFLMSNYSDRNKKKVFLGGSRE